MTGYSDPRVTASFERSTENGFTSVSTEQLPSPVLVVVNAVAAHLDQGGEIALPRGFTRERLDEIRQLAGQYDQTFNVSMRQAGEMASLGEAILELADAGELRGSVNVRDRALVDHLTLTFDTVAMDLEMEVGQHTQAVAVYVAGYRPGRAVGQPNRAAPLPDYEGTDIDDAEVTIVDPQSGRPVENREASLPSGPDVVDHTVGKPGGAPEVPPAGEAKRSGNGRRDTTGPRGVSL